MVENFCNLFFRDLRVQNILEKLVLQFNSQVFDFFALLEKKRDSKSCFSMVFDTLTSERGFKGRAQFVPQVVFF